MNYLRLIRFSIVPLLVVGMFFGAQQASAISVGISPATLKVIMLEGTSGEFTYHVSRSDSEGDLELLVGVEDADFASLPMGGEIVLLEGSQTLEVPIEFDAAGLAPGTYEASFFVRQKEATSTGQETLSIRYGVEAVIDLEVVSSDRYNELITGDVIEIHGNYFGNSSYKSRQTMVLNREIRNLENLYVHDLVMRTGLLDSNGELVGDEQEESLSLTALGNRTYKSEIQAPAAGTYTAVTSVYYQDQKLAESSVEITVEENDALGSTTTIILVIAILLAIFVGVRFVRKKK